MSLLKIIELNEQRGARHRRLRFFPQDSLKPGSAGVEKSQDRTAEERSFQKRQSATLNKLFRLIQIQRNKKIAIREAIRYHNRAARLSLSKLPEQRKLQLSMYLKLLPTDTENILRVFEELEPSELTESERRTFETVKRIRKLQIERHSANLRLGNLKTRKARVENLQTV